MNQIIFYLMWINFGKSILIQYFLARVWFFL